MNSVSAGSRSRVASTMSVESTFETKRSVRSRSRVEAQRLVRHHRPEVRAADPDVDDVADPLAGVAGPRARAHGVGERRHPVEHLVDLRDDVRAVDDQRGVARHPQRDVEHRAVLGDVDPVAAEHRVDVLAQAGLLGELEQQPQRLVVDPVLREVEVQADRVGAEALGAPGVRGEQVAEVGGGELVVVGLQRRPRGPVAQGRDVGQVLLLGSGRSLRTLPAEHARRYARAMPRPGSVRRRQAGVLVLGAAEPELGSWLRAEGHAIRTAAERGGGAGRARRGAGGARHRRPRAGRARCAGRVRRPARGRAARRRLAARDRRLVAPARRGAGLRRRRRRLPAPAVHARAAARARAHRPARRRAAHRRRGAALDARHRPRGDLPLRLARRAAARADHGRDRADLGLPRRQLRGQRQAHAGQHRPPRRPRDDRRRGRGLGRGRRPHVLARVPDRPRRRRDPLGARPRPAGQGRGRPDVDERRAVRHHRAARGRGGAAAARDRGGAHGGAARLARPHRRRRRRGPPQARARPPRRRAAAARVDGARRPRRPPPARRTTRRRPARSSTGWATTSPARPPSCASWPAASIRRC